MASPKGPPREVAAVWGLAAASLVAVLVTYSRLNAAELYNVSGSGARGGLGRAVVELDFPVALVALAVLAVVAETLPRPARAVAALAALGCVVVVVPGVVRESDLDVRWINAVPALGVALAFACSLLARGPASPRRARGDRLRVALALVLVVLASPWIAAELGFYLDGVPVLGRLFQTGRIVSFHDAPHHAVHHGVHHGLQGLLLVLTALLLSRVVAGGARAGTRRGHFSLHSSSPTASATSRTTTGSSRSPSAAGAATRFRACSSRRRTRRGSPCSCSRW
jgi:hypothetical protein